MLMFDEHHLSCHDLDLNLKLFFFTHPVRFHGPFFCPIFSFSSESGNFNGIKRSFCTCSQTGVQVLHGISALVKMEQTEPRIRAFLKKVPG